MQLSAWLKVWREMVVRMKRVEVTAIMGTSQEGVTGEEATGEIIGGVAGGEGAEEVEAGGAEVEGDEAEAAGEAGGEGAEGDEKGCLS